MKKLLTDTAQVDSVWKVLTILLLMCEVNRQQWKMAAAVKMLRGNKEGEQVDSWRRSPGKWVHLQKKTHPLYPRCDTVLAATLVFAFNHFIEAFCKWWASLSGSIQIYLFPFPSFYLWWRARSSFLGKAPGELKPAWEWHVTPLYGKQTCLPF